MKKEEHFIEKAKAEQEALNWFIEKKRKEGIQILATESPTNFSSFDNWIASGSTEFIAEIKVRKDITGALADKWGGPLFEMTKHSGICEYKEQFNHQNEVLYINFFSDEMRVYKIRKDPTYYSWFLKKLPKDNYDKRLIWKCVVGLQEDDLIETIKYGKNNK